MSGFQAAKTLLGVRLVGGDETGARFTRLEESVPGAAEQSLAFGNIYVGIECDARRDLKGVADDVL